MPRTKNVARVGMAYAFWLRFWLLTRKVAEHLEGHDSAKERFRQWAANELILEVERHVITRSNGFVDEKALGKYYLANFLFETGKVCTVSQAVQTLPDAIFQLEGSSTLTRAHFNDLNERARDNLERYDAQLEELAASLQAQQAQQDTQPLT